jgi:hypothetical protein
VYYSVELQVVRTGKNQRSKNGQLVLVWSLVKSSCTIYKRQKKLRGTISRVWHGLWTSAWCGPWTSARPMRVVLSFCLQNGPKGMGPLRKILGLSILACLES